MALSPSVVKFVCQSNYMCSMILSKHCLGQGQISAREAGWSVPETPPNPDPWIPHMTRKPLGPSLHNKPALSHQSFSQHSWLFRPWCCFHWLAHRTMQEATDTKVFSLWESEVGRNEGSCLPTVWEAAGNVQVNQWCRDAIDNMQEWPTVCNKPACLNLNQLIKTHSTLVKSPYEEATPKGEMLTSTSKSQCPKTGPTTNPSREFANEHSIN